jgi:GNAT superfamily N-acetyltransferase
VTRVELVTQTSSAPAIRFLTEWVTGDEAGAHRHLADHASGGGSSFVAIQGEVVGIVTVRWRSNNPALGGIPLVHQISVAHEHRGRGIATALMDAAEDLARDRGHRRIGITVGLFAEYGPAQRMYARRGYVPDGRGVCRGATPVREGETVTVDHGLLLWLIKDLSA